MNAAHSTLSINPSFENWANHFLKILMAKGLTSLLDKINSACFTFFYILFFIYNFILYYILYFITKTLLLLIYIVSPFLILNSEIVFPLSLCLISIVLLNLISYTSSYVIFALSPTITSNSKIVALLLIFKLNL